jgi:hypothetical protein
MEDRFLLILWISSVLIRCGIFFVRSMSLLTSLPILLLFVRSSFFARVTLQLRISFIILLLFGVSLTLLALSCPLSVLHDQTTALELHWTYDFLTRLRGEFEPLRAQLLARRPYVSLMYALAEVYNEEVHLCDAVFCSLLLSWLLALRLVVLHLLDLLLRCHLPHLWLFLLLLVVRVVVFTVLTVVVMAMWSHSAIGRRKLRLTVLH